MSDATPDLALSHTAGPKEPALLEQTIGDNLDATIARVPERDALVDRAAGIRWTYAELGAEVDRLARALIAVGVAKGDRVGIWAPNCAEWTRTQYATAKVGAILVTINPAYRSHELTYVLNQAGVRLLVTAASFRSSDYVAMVDSVRQECSALEEFVVLGQESWATLLERAEEVSPERLSMVQADLEPARPDQRAVHLRHNGFPQGCDPQPPQHPQQRLPRRRDLPLHRGGPICIPVPFYHCFGMVMGNLAATSHGACTVIPAPGFDPALTLEAVAEERCTSLYGVPTMFIAEWALPGFESYDLTSVRTGIMAGSPCPESTMTKLIEAGIDEMTICYGMTETSPVSTQTRPDDSFERKVGTVGAVHPHLEIKVVDPVTRETLPRGEAGELCTKGYSVMLGYWDEPEKTAEVLVDGWMHTGDLAVLDTDGYVRITGRIKDMVIRGGENIYPREIEEFLHTHPDVLDVAGHRRARLAVRRGAVRVGPGSRRRDPLTAEALRDYADGRLAHYKIPRYVRLVDEFPMTVTGKVRKVEMREVTVSELGL